MAEQACTISKSMTVKGDISGNEALVVAGRVEGSITLSKGLSVEPDGVVQANVDVEDLTVSGTLEGDVRSSHGVTIHANAQLVGDVAAPRVSIEDGAHFSGRIEMEVELPDGIKA